jgi:hypothetical protein
VRTTDVAASICVRLRVTVRTQQSQVPDLVVRSISVDVVELKGNRAAIPFGLSAAGAPMSENALA